MIGMTNHRKKMAPAEKNKNGVPPLKVGERHDDRSNSVTVSILAFDAEGPGFEPLIWTFLIRTIVVLPSFERPRRDLFGFDIDNSWFELREFWIFQGTV